MNKQLIDPHQRRIRKVRISLLDACNFRCFYCMPEKPKFLPAKNWLTGEEIERICQVFWQHGIEEIRLTGGEPTLRKDFQDIVRRLSKIPFRKLGLTTNGYSLNKFLPVLKDSKCQFINISLDSLREDRFNDITRTHAFHKVMNSIKSAAKLGFVVKINVVLMKGINDDELLDFVKFSAEHQITVRFLEVMKIGQACTLQKEVFLAAEEAIRTLLEKESLTPVIKEYDSTSFEFTSLSGARIGFISPVSQSFCHSCSRWRLSAEGFLRACLMSQKGLALKGQSTEELAETFSKVLMMKPLSGLDAVSQNMHAIGG